jgi:hypothetical protein
MKLSNHQRDTSLLLLVVFLASTPSVVSSFLTKSVSDNNHVLLFPRHTRPGVLVVTTQPRSSYKNILQWRGGGVAAPFSSSGTSRDASLEQFAGPASDLFGNMITPASILCGAIIPLCFASGLEFDGPADESKFRKGAYHSQVCHILTLLLSLTQK